MNLKKVTDFSRGQNSCELGTSIFVLTWENYPSNTQKGEETMTVIYIPQIPVMSIENPYSGCLAVEIKSVNIVQNR